MKLHKFALAAILGVAVIVVSCKHFPPVEEEPLLQGRIEIVEIPSSDSTIIHNALIYLPIGYDRSVYDSFPVIYILHDFDQDFAYLEDVYSVCEILDRMVSRGRVPGVILVFVDGSNEFGGSFYTDSDIYGHFETYLEDVRNFVESNYKVMADSAFRCLLGVGEMGGYGALRHFLRHPHDYGTVAAHSPIIDPLDYATENLLNRALGENGGRLPNPPDLSEGKPATRMLFALAAAFTPKSAPLDSFDLAYEFPIQPADSDSSVWFGVRLPFDTLGNPIGGEIAETWSQNSILAVASESMDSIWDTAAVWLDVGCDEPQLQPKIETFVDSLEAHGVKPVFEIYSGDPAYPDSIVPSTVRTRLFSRIGRSLEYLIYTMWLRL
ncbi:MAG: hypothetical protein DRQ10_05215 [Candidatus Hydrothermota bacterium]|nr:MAG: hypothetical protein DRQ10_05215 [Candidatus Hydrothermae bacterium]